MSKMKGLVAMRSDRRTVVVFICIITILMIALGLTQYSFNKRIELYENVMILDDVEHIMNELSFLMVHIERLRDEEQANTEKVEFNDFHADHYFQIYSYDLLPDRPITDYLRAIYEELDRHYAMIDRIVEIEGFDYEAIIERYNLLYIKMSHLSTGNLDVNTDEGNIQGIIEALYSIRYDIAAE